jgi:Aspartyl protease
VSTTLLDVLQKARHALGCARLGVPRGHIVLAGPSERHGLAGRCALTIAPSGAFLDRFEGPLSTALGFDGETGWGLDMTGMPMRLDLDDLETPRLVYGVLSGQWLAEGGGFQVEFDPRESEGKHIGLRLRVRGAATDSALFLDRATWLPSRLERPLVGWMRSWEFSNYRMESGLTLPRKLVHSQGGLADVDHFESLTLQSDALESPCRPVTTEPDDHRFDGSVSARLALRRIPSGHVFVRPKIDGAERGWFALDTGSGAGFTILASLADEIGMPRLGRVAGGGAGSAIQIAALRRGKTFELGPMTITGSVYLELPPELNVTLKRLADIDVVGTCGYDLFRRCIVELDLARSEVVLHPRDGGPQPKAWFGLNLQHRIPSLHCEFEGGHSGQFQIDTGAGPLVLFHSPAVRRLRLLDGRRTAASEVRGAEGSVETQVGQLAWIDIAGERRTDVRALFVTGESGALADPHTAGTFGAILLAPKRIVFDYGRQRMALID